MRAAALIFTACFACAPADAHAARDPLAIEFKKMEGRGYLPQKKAVARIGKGRLAMVLYETGAGGKEMLLVYRIRQGRARRIHFAPGATRNLALSSIHSRGGIPDLFGDGSRVLAYRIIFSGLDQETLVLLRFKGGKLTKIKDLPFGRFEDLDGDGRLEVISKTRPLGPGFFFKCRGFFTRAPNAFQTTIYAFENGELVNVSRQHGPFFEDHIRSLREDLSVIDARFSGDYSEYLGLAVSLYLDYAAMGMRREGWREFQRHSPVRRTDPRGMRRCMKKMNAQLRERFDIPDSW